MNCRLYVLLFALLISFPGSAFSQAQSWSLHGNTGIRPGTDFLGTTDAQPLVIGTNSRARLTITSDGRVGINEDSPQFRLVISSSQPDNHLLIDGTAPSIIFDGAPGPNNEGRIGYATQRNNFVHGSLPGDFIIQALGARASLIFGTGGGGTGNGIEVARFDEHGYLGIGTARPTARLHVECAGNGSGPTTSAVRFAGLPPGRGHMLVIDPEGYVYRRQEQITEAAFRSMQKQLRQLQKEVKALRALLTTQ